MQSAFVVAGAVKVADCIRPTCYCLIEGHSETDNPAG